MENIKILNFPILLFNVFAYQHFLLSEIFEKIKTQNLSRISIFNIFKFFIKLSITLSISYYCNFAVLSSSPDISSTQNILHYVMKFLIAGGRVVLCVIYIFEGFLRTKNLKIIFKNSFELQKIIIQHFLYKINFKIILKIFIRDVIFSVIISAILEGTYFYRNYSKPYITLLFIIRCLRTFISAVEIIKFRFYINFINLHLQAILRILNQKFLEFSKSNFECLRRINAIRTCYILVLNMMKNLEIAIWLTTTLSIFLEIVTCVRRLYRWYSIVQGVLEPNVLSCEY